MSCARAILCAAVAGRAARGVAAAATERRRQVGRGANGARATRAGQQDSRRSVQCHRPCARACVAVLSGTPARAACVTVRRAPPAAWGQAGPRTVRASPRHARAPRQPVAAEPAPCAQHSARAGKRASRCAAGAAPLVAATRWGKPHARASCTRCCARVARWGCPPLQLTRAACSRRQSARRGRRGGACDAACRSGGESCSPLRRLSRSRCVAGCARARGGVLLQACVAARTHPARPPRATWAHALTAVVSRAQFGCGTRQSARQRHAAAAQRPAAHLARATHPRLRPAAVRRGAVLAAVARRTLRRAGRPVAPGLGHAALPAQLRRRGALRRRRARGRGAARRAAVP